LCLCFPHFEAEVFPDHFSVLVSYPIAPDKTRKELHIFLIGEVATSDLYKEAPNAIMTMWGNLNKEKHIMLERLQQADCYLPVTVAV
jgi:choline monooxygenase